MSYATPTDIQAEFKELKLDVDTQMTVVKVQEFLDQADAIIDSYLGTVYATPITGARALKIVQKIEIDLVASRVAKVLQIKNAAVLDGKGVRQELIDQSAYKHAIEYLKDLAARTATLIDAGLISAGAGMQASTFYAEFDRDGEQW